MNILKSLGASREFPRDEGRILSSGKTVWAKVLITVATKVPAKQLANELCAAARRPVTAGGFISANTVGAADDPRNVRLQGVD